MTLRVGIVGAGNIFARGYLPAIRQTDVLAVEMVTDIDADRARQAAGALGGVRVAATDEELIGNDELDAVFILTPTDTHAELTVAALDAGRHVLCEKPMARSLADARRMTDAAARSERRLMIGHTRRFDERWMAIDDQVRSGRIGAPVYLGRVEHAHNGAPAGAWLWRNEQSGGVLWDVGVHVAELIGWYFGEPPRSAYCRLLHVRPEAEAGGAPDAAVVVFDCGPMRHAMLSVSWMHPPFWGPLYAGMELVGTEGRLDYRDIDAHPTLLVGGDRLTIPHYSPLLSATATAFRREIEHFAMSIEADAPFAVSAEDALLAIAIVDAAERSAGSGRPEAIRP